MADLRELYQEVVFEHNRNPRNFGKLPGANRSAEGYNPLCGDKLHLYIQVEDGVIKDIKFEGSGCAISTASASIMTEMLKGKTEDEAEDLFNKFHGMVTKTDKFTPVTGLGKLEVLSGVREFPARVKCATLAWHTLHAALQNRGVAASTE